MLAAAVLRVDCMHPVDILRHTVIHAGFVCKAKHFAVQTAAVTMLTHLQGHWEKPPYDNSSIRSAYHVRELDVYRLLQIHRHLDVFVSHDWPRGIANFGNKAQLFRAKPFLKREVIAALLWSSGGGYVGSQVLLNCGTVM